MLGYKLPIWAVDHFAAKDALAFGVLREQGYVAYTSDNQFGATETGREYVFDSDDELIQRVRACDLKVGDEITYGDGKTITITDKKVHDNGATLYFSDGDLWSYGEGQVTAEAMWSVIQKPPVYPTEPHTAAAFSEYIVAVGKWNRKHPLHPVGLAANLPRQGGKNTIMRAILEDDRK